MQCHIVERAGTLEVDLPESQSWVFLFSEILGKLFQLSNFFIWKTEILIATYSECYFEYTMA